MLINAEYDETRIAIVDNQRLESFSFEKIEQNRRRDNIYCAVVETIEPSLQAAFINYGAKRHGFLAMDDVNVASLGILQKPHAIPQIQDILKVGQKVLVQGLRDEIGNKCASFSMNLKLRGRFMIFLPHQRKGGVSKKITDTKEHERLKFFVEGLKNSHQESATIIRSASEGRSLSDLKKDFTSLQGQYQNILKKFSKAKGGSMIQQEASPAVRILREDFAEDIAEICVDHPETFQEVQYFFKQHLPNYQKNIKLYLGNRSIFTEYGIERQVEALQSNRVALPSGGGIVIDQTEALVAIDVNSGSALQGDNIEETAICTNLEAVEEIARQLRLRNLGGLIVVDFIDMNAFQNRKQVVDAMRLVIKKDRAHIKIGTISKFGLLEMSRQRIDSSVVQNVQNRCSACRGTGLQPTIEATANDVLRKAREIAALDHIAKIRVSLDHTLANYLFNYKRSHLEEIEVASGIQVLWEIKTSDALNGQTIFEFLRTGQSKYKQFVFKDKPLPILPKTQASEDDLVQKKLSEEHVRKTPYLKVVSEQTEISKEDSQIAPEEILQILPTSKKQVVSEQTEISKEDSQIAPEEILQILPTSKEQAVIVQTDQVKFGKIFASVHRSYPDDAVPLPEVIEKEKQWQDVPIFTTIYRSEHQGDENLQTPLIEAIDDEEALATPKKKKATKKTKAESTKKKIASSKKKKTGDDLDLGEDAQTPESSENKKSTKKTKAESTKSNATAKKKTTAKKKKAESDDSPTDEKVS